MSTRRRCGLRGRTYAARDPSAAWWQSLIIRAAPSVTTTSEVCTCVMSHVPSLQYSLLADGDEHSTHCSEYSASSSLIKHATA